MEITITYQRARNLGIPEEHANALNGMTIEDTEHFHVIHRGMLSKARSCAIHNDQQKADAMYRMASMLRMYYDSVAYSAPASAR
jgi:hypothetical protein